MHVVLEQVGPPIRTRLQQGEDVGRFGVLAEHHHPYARVRPPQLRSHTNALVGVRRRHPDVRDDDIGSLRRHALEYLAEVAAGGHDIDAGVAGEDLSQALADDDVVVRQDDSDHAAYLTRRGVRLCPENSPDRDDDPEWRGF